MKAMEDSWKLSNTIVFYCIQPSTAFSRTQKPEGDKNQQNALVCIELGCKTPTQSTN